MNSQPQSLGWADLRMSLLFFSHSIVSDSFWPHGPQHTRLPCLLPSPGACSNTCPLSRWCPSNHLILCCPLLLPSTFPGIGVFSSESAIHIRWPKYWSFSFSSSPSNAYSGLISFRMDWFISLKIRVSQKSSLGPQFKSIKKLFSFWY